MTRDEAATAIGWLRNGPVKVHTFLEDAFGYKVADEIMEGLKAAVTALRGPIPDPETGLVPCGCGGFADTDSGYWNIVYCTECRDQTGSFADIEDAKKVWNKAHGYKEEV